MADSVSHKCSECGHKMDVPARYVGTQQKCRKCGIDFLVALPTTKKCPFCAEEIKIEAVLCRFCGHELGDANQPAAAVVGESSTVEAGQLKAAQGGPRHQVSNENWWKWVMATLAVPLIFGLPLILQIVQGDRLEEPALISGILAVLSFMILAGIAGSQRPRGKPLEGNWAPWIVASIVFPLILGLPLIIGYGTGGRMGKSAVISGSLAVLSFLIFAGIGWSQRPGRRVSRRADTYRPSVIVVVGGGFIGLCVLLAIWATLFPTDDMKERKRRQRAGEVAKQAAEERRSAEEMGRAGAWVAAKEFVNRRLKAPGSAEFPWLHEVTVQNQGNGRFRVVAWVDAQNSFGALIRTHFSCTVRKGDGEWILEELNMQE